MMSTLSAYAIAVVASPEYVCCFDVFGRDFCFTPGPDN